jgi:hypothetical protein
MFGKHLRKLGSIMTLLDVDQKLKLVTVYTREIHFACESGGTWKWWHQSSTSKMAKRKTSGTGAVGHHHETTLLCAPLGHRLPTSLSSSVIRPIIPNVHEK